MSTATEPEIQFTRATFTSTVAPNTSQVDTLLAAPGAGLRYRIYGISARLNSNAVAGTLGRLNLLSGVVVAGTFLEGNLGTGASFNPSIPDQGIPLAANAALSVLEAFSAASVPYDIAALYVIETV